MHQNTVWFGFLIIVITITLWFTGKATYELVSYYRLSNQAPITIEKQTIKEDKSNQFVVTTQFSFAYNGECFNGIGNIGDQYPNFWAAEQVLGRLSKKTWTAWFNPKHPSKAVLEKKFPYKSIFSAAILFALVLYFFYLGIYARFNNTKLQ